MDTKEYLIEYNKVIEGFYYCSKRYLDEENYGGENTIIREVLEIPDVFRFYKRLGSDLSYFNALNHKYQKDSMEYYCAMAYKVYCKIEPVLHFFELYSAYNKNFRDVEILKNKKNDPFYRTAIIQEKEYLKMLKDYIASLNKDDLKKIENFLKQDSAARQLENSNKTSKKKIKDVDAFELFKKVCRSVEREKNKTVENEL